MKISRTDISKAVNLYDKNNNQIEKQKIEKIKEKKDSIEISKAGKELSTLDISDNKTSSAEKLEKIRKEIKNGTYKVDAKLVAKKMIDIMKGREG